MKQQSGMLLLEVLLAMAIFSTAIIALLTSMQWQLSALETLKQETLAIWVADNVLVTATYGQLAAKAGESSQLDKTFSWQLAEEKQGSSPLQQKEARVITSDGRTLSLYAWFPESKKAEAKHE
ncbi:type II secretion system minor pseudopilin GspI [Enterobacter sp. KBR-315C3_2022]|uniref:type II secretion system minor pseudopilin GspI n=1 Tax=Enterobacter sp. KBR-315C3_2022 TaxID=3242494 RepID=UPI003527BE76